MHNCSLGEGKSIGSWKTPGTHDPSTLIYPTVPGFVGLNLAEEIDRFKWNCRDDAGCSLSFHNKDKGLECDCCACPLQHKVGGDLRGVFRIPVARKARGPRWFPNGDAIPKQNELGGTVVPGKSHGGAFMQFTDEIRNQF